MNRSSKHNGHGPAQAGLAIALGAMIFAMCLACGSSTTAAAYPSGVNERFATPTRDLTRGTIVRRRDEFRAQESLRLDYNLPGPLDVSLMGMIPSGGVLLVSFRGESEGWRYLRCHAVDALRDGQPFPMPPPRHDGDVRRGGVSERVYIELSDETADLLASARSLRFRVCNDVITFDAGQLAMLGTYLRQLRGDTDGGTAEVAIASPGEPSGTPGVGPLGTGCTLPVEAVLVCRSSRGYQFALPVPGYCSPGSELVRTIQLTCADLARPAYHACLEGASGWRPVRSWETCRSFGLEDAPGDFLPLGRSPSQGVGPDQPAAERPSPRVLRCYTPTGSVLPTEAATCAAAGLADSPDGVVAARPAPPPTTPVPEPVAAPIVAPVPAMPATPLETPIASPTVEPAPEPAPAPRRHHHHRR